MIEFIKKAYIYTFLVVLGLLAGAMLIIPPILAVLVHWAFVFLYFLAPLVWGSLLWLIHYVDRNL